MLRKTMLAAAPLALPAIARASEEEIKIGNTMPYSGPAGPGDQHRLQLQRWHGTDFDALGEVISGT
jgi:hypothetical protein